MELSLALLEKNMVICRFYFVGLPCVVWKPFELCFSLWRAYELNLKIFGSEQALVSGNKPREREDGAPGDIANNFSTQGSTPLCRFLIVLNAPNPRTTPVWNSEN